MPTPPPSPVPVRTATERLLLRLEWRVLRRVEGRVAGAYRTVHRGAGIDLAGLRVYAEGDDARHIDWNVTARLNEPQLRVFNEDREITVWLVLDRSASMTVGAPGRGKQDVLSELAVVLARMFSRGGNRVGALLYDNGTVRTVPPGTGRRHVLYVAGELSRPSQGAADHANGNGRRRHGAHLVTRQVVEQRADPVPAPAEQPGEDQGELADHVVLAASGRAHRHGRGPVQHQPDHELAVLVEHAKLRLVQPGGDVPVDVPGVVAFDVLAQPGEVCSGSPVRGAVAACQASVEAADDTPLQPEQQPFLSGSRRPSGLGCHQRPLRATSGTATASSTCVMRWSALTSSASASYDSTMRCRSTSRAISPTSAGSA